MLVLNKQGYQLNLGMLPEISQLEQSLCDKVTLKVATVILRVTDQLYQTISKSYSKQQNYGLETNLLQGCPVTLTIVTGTLCATCPLAMTYQIC